jgi:hypothetical protein
MERSLQGLGVEGDVLESVRRRSSFDQRGMTPRERFGIDSPTTIKKSKRSAISCCLQ